MADHSATVEKLKQIAQQFAQERDWKQFHTPKNLAMNIGIEAAELMDFFVWLDNEGAEKALISKRTAIEDEIADIFLSLMLFCNNTGIDLSVAFENKLEKLRAKYPSEAYKGKSVAQMFEHYDEKHWKSRLRKDAANS